MENVTRELSELKKEHGQERKLRKSDSSYPDYLKALEIAEEIKQLMAEKKQVLEDLKKQLLASEKQAQMANFQSV